MIVILAFTLAAILVIALHVWALNHASSEHDQLLAAMEKRPVDQTGGASAPHERT